MHASKIFIVELIKLYGTHQYPCMVSTHTHTLNSNGVKCPKIQSKMRFYTGPFSLKSHFALNLRTFYISCSNSVSIQHQFGLSNMKFYLKALLFIYLHLMYRKIFFWKFTNYLLFISNLAMHRYHIAGESVVSKETVRWAHSTMFRRVVYDIMFEYMRCHMSYYSNMKYTVNQSLLVKFNACMIYS